MQRYDWWNRLHLIWLQFPQWWSISSRWTVECNRILFQAWFCEKKVVIVVIRKLELWAYSSGLVTSLAASDFWINWRCESSIALDQPSRDKSRLCGPCFDIQLLIHTIFLNGVDNMFGLTGYVLTGAHKCQNRMGDMDFKSIGNLKYWIWTLCHHSCVFSSRNNTTIIHKSSARNKACSSSVSSL